MRTNVEVRNIKDEEQKGQSIALNISLVAETEEDKGIINIIRKSPEGAMELGVVTVSCDKPEVEIELVL